MEELINFIVPSGKDFQLVDPVEYNYWTGRKQRCFYIDYELEDDYQCVELMKTIIQMNFEEKDIPEEELEPIRLFLFSYGGDLSQATALCDVIEASRIPIITVCMGVAMSAGFLIFLAGKRRYAFKQSTLLVHQGSAAFSGSASEIEEAQKNYKKTLDKMKDYIVSHTDIDEKLFKKNQSKDWYIEGEDISKLNIATVITSFDEIV